MPRSATRSARRSPPYSPCCDLAICPTTARAAVSADGSPSRGMTVVAFADLVGFTALTQAHGDAEAVVVADRLAELADRSLRPGVEVVKTIGDAVMLQGEEVSATIETVMAPGTTR